MAAVTVVLSTCRLGGMDVIFPTLKVQTFKDFDVILVDYWYDARKIRLREYLKSIGFENKVIHIPPKAYGPSPNADAAYNTAFALCTSDLVCITSDFMHLPSTYVEDHWRVFVGFGGRASLIGKSLKIPPPELVADASVDNCKLTCFAEPWLPLFHISGASLPNEPRRMRITDTVEVDLKFLDQFSLATTAGYREVAWTCFFFTQHNSLPLAILHSINGINEIYDGAFGGADIDMGFRVAMSGHRFVTHPNIDITIEVDHHRFPMSLNFPSGIPDTERFKVMMEERILGYANGSLPLRAENNGFDVSQGPLALAKYDHVMKALEGQI